MWSFLWFVESRGHFPVVARAVSCLPVEHGLSGMQASAAVAVVSSGLQSTAQQFWLTCSVTYGIFPDPAGFIALTGRFFTTETPGKPSHRTFLCYHSMQSLRCYELYFNKMHLNIVFNQVLILEFVLISFDIFNVINLFLC